MGRENNVLHRRSDYLKIIAMVTMAMDHIAFYFLPYSSTSYIIMRMIGRIAFPIFAYFIAMGYKDTSDLNRYILRMGIFALAAQIPFYFFVHKVFYLNVMFTFTLALIMLKLFDKKNYLWFALIFLADFLKMDYGAYGLIIILIFHVFSEEKIKIYVYLLILTFVYSSLNVMQYGAFSIRLYTQVLCVMALPLIYRDFPALRINKYISYLFYPVHIGIIVLIGNLIR
ncbi:MAG: TraX family protein [Clostridiales bacterium 38_11]|nr:MAG: TraX family protein [Clostridiales bacterium 38_11]